MGGEYCTCPTQPCPICRDTNLCGCGCGFEIGSIDFQKLHAPEALELSEIDPRLNDMSYQEWCEECNPTYEQLAKYEQLQRRDY